MRFAVLSTIAVLFAFPSMSEAAGEHPSSNYLWYKQPAVIQRVAVPWSHEKSLQQNVQPQVERKVADSWESQTLPVGNGRVGGTVYGGDCLEQVVLNEVSLWTGGPNLPNNGAGYAYGPKANKDQFGSYQPFANLFIDFGLDGKSENYSRSLNLRNGIAAVDFTNGGVKHRRECFVSHGADVLVYTATADKEGSITARIALTPYHDATFSPRKDGLLLKGTLANGEEFAGLLQVRIKGGKMKAFGKTSTVEVTYDGGGRGQMPAYDGKKLPYVYVKDADELEIIVSLSTDYKMSYAAGWKGRDPQAANAAIMKKLEGKSVDKIRKEHIRDYRKLFNRLSINLGKTDEDTAVRPTDERIRNFKGAADDPELISTIYQYGRYVLICGSRPGNLPVNLQGIWNNKVHAPWASDYHNNINLQMCYWGAEVANLSECHQPLLDFIEAMEEPLAEMTRKHFGSDIKGWTTRISQNPWGGGGWTHWNPPVNAWYALHLWDHYQFTQDKKYLATQAYPILKNICQFWESRLKTLGAQGKGLISNKKPLSAEDYPELKEIKAGTLVSPAGWSHEWGPVEDGCMHDQQLIDELFRITVSAAKILNKDESWAESLEEKRRKLAPNRIAKGGYLQEWIVDRPNMVSGQRHTSHLVGVYPGSSISVAQTPDLAAAAMKSLELRGQTGDNRRSWTWPWRTALWARFKKPDKAIDMVNGYVEHNLLDNMFGNHPPMQMDGTYGMTGGMSEMFVQSHAGLIELLPALPSDVWPEGSIRGIKARGNIEVSMKWKDGKLTDYSLTTPIENPQPVKVLANGRTQTVTPTYTPSKKVKKKPARKKRARRK